MMNTNDPTVEEAGLEHRRETFVAFCDACDKGAGFDSYEQACDWLDRHELEHAR